MALPRIQKELSDVSDPGSDHQPIKLATPVFEDDLFKWRVIINHPAEYAAAERGAFDGLFYGVEILFEVTFPSEYPLRPFLAEFDPDWKEAVTAVLSRVPKRKTGTSATSASEILEIERGKELDADEALRRHALMFEEEDARAKLVSQSQPRLPRGSDMQMFIKTLTGKTITIDTHTNCLIGDLKREIETREGIPAGQQRLMATGKELESGRTLADYSIRSSHSVHLIPQFRSCNGFLPSTGTAQWNPAHTVHKGFLRAGLMLWKTSEATDGCWECTEQRIAELCKGVSFTDAHWVLRCISPSNILWSPETDKMWPMTFRKIIRYLARIEVSQGSGQIVSLPQEIAFLIGTYL